MNDFLYSLFDFLRLVTALAILFTFSVVVLLLVPEAAEWIAGKARRFHDRCKNGEPRWVRWVRLFTGAARG